ncbi:hypothetical protein C0966_17475 (plasmid) [Bacillus methanolicus]|uniref:hypothetical protein n=1 Tax=Bacillus methanolicus TaxID=1471 RepID=UPI0023800F7D|nr:hypothetical protein [Bacillus methanolicus]MDE3841055.1 hypothetical protein [Bacillus methanolicus]
MKKIILRLVIFILAGCLISFIAFKTSHPEASFYLSIIVVTTLLFFGIDMFNSLLKNGNKFVIFGFLLLLFTVVTYALQLWDHHYIHKPFILSVAIAAILFTFSDLIDTTDFKKQSKETIKTLIFILGSISIIAILMIKHPSFVSYLDDLNTDYLTFVSLGIALSTIGLRNEKIEKESKEKPNEK